MLIGHDMAVGAHHEAGAGLVERLGRLRKRWSTRRGGRRRGNGLGDGRCNGEVAGIGNAIFLHAQDAIEQRRQQLRRLAQGELKQLSCRKAVITFSPCETG